MTEKELRRLVCDTARSYLGCRESDGSHRGIIDRYNKITPLPRGCRMGYSDPWCAAFVSAVGAQCGLTKILFPECSCDAMIARYKAAGRWEEQDFAVPKEGDLLFYDWQDEGSGDCRGGADHVGIVTAVTGNLLRVIEGNTSDAVGERSVHIDARFLRGYGQPDYASMAEEEAPAKTRDGAVGAAISRPSAPAPVSVSLTLPQLSRGSSGEAVRAAQLLLIGRGCRCGVWGADGDFGAATQGAVQSFQRGRQLAVDGVIGAETWRALLTLGEGALA